MFSAGGAPSFAVQGSVPPSPGEGHSNINPYPKPLPPGLLGRWSGDSCAPGGAGAAAGQGVGHASNPTQGAEAPAGGRRSGDGGRPRIHPLPPKPLMLLRELVQHIKVPIATPFFPDIIKCCGCCISLVCFWKAC